ncbi:MAG: hypothetical protein RPU61_09595 [Candidatus Sedimenticola sp. (ex Thyasira tokunagai)]
MSGLIAIIQILEHDRVWEYGKEKYGVNKGDLLEVISSQKCKYKKARCWEVYNTKTGEFGYVEVKRMKKMHRIFIKK